MPSPISAPLAAERIRPRRNAAPTARIAAPMGSTASQPSCRSAIAVCPLAVGVGPSLNGSDRPGHDQRGAADNEGDGQDRHPAAGFLPVGEEPDHGRRDEQQRADEGERGPARPARVGRLVEAPDPDEREVAGDSAEREAEEEPGRDPRGAARVGERERTERADDEAHGREAREEPEPVAIAGAGPGGPRRPPA